MSTIFGLARRNGEVERVDLLSEEEGLGFMILDHNATPAAVPRGKALLVDPKLVEVFLDIALYCSLATR